MNGVITGVISDETGVVMGQVRLVEGIGINPVIRDGTGVVSDGTGVVSDMQV